MQWVIVGHVSGVTLVDTWIQPGRARVSGRRPDLQSVTLT
jgi:hypothetical protein